ncbi:MAG: glycosyltransferase family 9 protein, partial [Flammeovirgaceae bacterium]|nr:glycosyltransferase family 9 protein [Flammeovirgaceae bacterium]
LGVKMDLEGLDYFIPERDEVEKEWLPEDFRENYVVFAIGGQHATKRLPLLKMIELCFKINRPIILLGGKEDMANGELIEKFFMHHQTEGIPEELLQMRLSYKKTKIFNGCGKFNINQSASLIRDALVVFTHDTGMMHIAAAFKKRIYSIWGNTTPDFGMYPYRTRFTVLENNNLKCRPCSKIGYDKCPKGHFKCMNELVFNFYMNTSE